MTRWKRAEVLALVGTAATLAGLGYAVVRDRVTGAAKMGNAEKRAAVVAAAMAEVGEANLSKYFGDAAPAMMGSGANWCGIFALWALHQAGLAKGIQWVVSRGFLFRLRQTTSPQPGDIAYFDKAQHHALVRAVRADEVDLINGNGTGGVVTLSTAPKSKARAYFSIEPFLEGA